MCKFNCNLDYVWNAIIVYFEAFMAPQIDTFCKFSVSIAEPPPGASHWLLWRRRLHGLMDSWLWGRGPVIMVFSGSDTTYTVFKSIVKHGL